VGLSNAIVVNKVCLYCGFYSVCFLIHHMNIKFNILKYIKKPLIYQH